MIPTAYVEGNDKANSKDNYFNKFNKFIHNANANYNNHDYVMTLQVKVKFLYYVINLDESDKLRTSNENIKKAYQKRILVIFLVFDERL